MKRSIVAVLVVGLVTTLTVAPASTQESRGSATDSYTGDLATARAAQTGAAEAFDAQVEQPAGTQAFTDIPLHFWHPTDEPVSFKQPNGKVFAARIRPMEVGGGAETWTTGYTVLKRSDGWYTYAVYQNGKVVPGTARVGVDRPPTGLQQHLGMVPETIYATPDNLAVVRQQLFQYLSARSAAQTQAATLAGEPRVFKIPVLMLETYSEFQPTSTPQFFEDYLMNPASNPNGTFAELYDEMSYGKFQVDVDVYGPYTSVPSQADRCFYGTEGSMFGGQVGLGGGGARGQTAEAVPQADPDVNFGEYDNDNDGMVDFLIILHSGPDAAGTGDPCMTWSHMFPPVAGEPAAVTTDTNAEGEPVAVGITMTIPEIDLEIGVTAHELMHGLGEPDYYGTDYQTAGTGDWDLGAGGSWYGDPPGSGPLHFNPVVKMNQGWAEPTLVQSTRTNVALRPRETSTDLLWVPTRLDTSMEFCELGLFGYENITDSFKVGDRCAVEGFFIEQNNRAAKERIFDRFSLSSGVLVWHYDLSQWRQGGNNTPLISMVDLEEFDRRDGTQDLQLNLGRGGPLDAFAADPVGISSATVDQTPLTLAVPAQTTSVTGVPASGFACTVSCPPEQAAATPIPAFTVDATKDVKALVVTGTWAGSSGAAPNDWDFYVDRKNPDGSWTMVRRAATEDLPEVATVILPAPGEYRVRAFNYASTEGTATVKVEQFTGSIPQVGPSSTVGNDGNVTGWSFTNIRPATAEGPNVPFEYGAQTVTLDLIKHDGTTTDLSPDYITVDDGPLQTGRTSTLVTRVYQHGGKAVPAGTKVRFLYGKSAAKGTLIAEQTLPSLGGYEQLTVRQTYRPAKNEGPLSLWVQVVPPGGVSDLVPANNVVGTATRVYPAAASVLVVDDDEGFEAEEAYAGVLAALKVPFAVADNTADAATMGRFKAVIWHTANQRFNGQLDAAERDAVKQYLAGGGNFWLAGPNAPRAFDNADPRSGNVDPEFLHEYFGVTYVDSFQRGTGTVSGTGDTVLGATKLELTIPYARPLMDYFRMGTASDGTASTLGVAKAFGTFDGVSGAVVGSRMQALDFRTVLTSFDLIQLTEAADRTKLVGDILKWFGITTPATQKLPLQVFHAAVRSSQPGLPASIVAAVPGSPTSVKLFYRAAGTTTWTQVAMTGVGGVYSAVIPASRMVRDGVEYYIQAVAGKKSAVAPLAGATTPYYIAIRS